MRTLHSYEQLGRQVEAEAELVSDFKQDLQCTLSLSLARWQTCALPRWKLEEKVQFG